MWLIFIPFEFFRARLKWYTGSLWIKANILQDEKERQVCLPEWSYVSSVIMDEDHGSGKPLRIDLTFQSRFFYR